MNDAGKHDPRHFVQRSILFHADVIRPSKQSAVRLPRLDPPPYPKQACHGWSMARIRRDIRAHYPKSQKPPGARRL